MKVYTGAGDKGMTGLFSGERVPKSHLRVEANGALDELNSFLGALAAALSEDHPALVDEIQGVQSQLLQMGAWLATTPDSSSADHLEEITTEPIRALELAIGTMEKELPALKGFILPGGNMTAAWAHVARTVCRRAERRVVRLLDGSEGGKSGGQLLNITAYLNRLSDYLFVLARYCNRLAQVPDYLWK
jgi:cob(I)alamin adenosyltransferase